MAGTSAWREAVWMKRVDESERDDSGGITSAFDHQEVVVERHADAVHVLGGLVSRDFT